MKTIVTHNGSFHSDDVFAVATLQLVYGVDSVTVTRTRDEAVIAVADIVVDVGGVYDVVANRFDHHQIGAPVRENGVAYAAFGLIWKMYGKEVSGSVGVASEIERALVVPIDAGDTGASLYTLNDANQKPFELYQVIRSYHPAWGSAESKDDAFERAVEFARGLLSRLITKKKAEVEMQKVVTEVYEASSDKRCLEFSVPVSSALCIDLPDVEVVVMPNDPAVTTDWTATTIRKEHTGFEARVFFPESWRGLGGAELAIASGIPDAVFCHKGGFFFVAKSREGALRAAEMAR